MLSKLLLSVLLLICFSKVNAQTFVPFDGEALTAASQAQSCSHTSLIFVVDTASFINSNGMVATRHMMRSFGSQVLDVEGGSIFALVDASRIASGDLIISASLPDELEADLEVVNNASLRYFTPMNSVKFNAMTQEEKDGHFAAVKRQWLKAVDDFWQQAKSSLALREKEGTASDKLTFEQLEQIIDSTSKRLVRRHRTLMRQKLEEGENAETTTTEASAKSNVPEMPKSLTVVVLVNYSPMYKPQPHVGETDPVFAQLRRNFGESFELDRAELRKELFGGKTADTLFSGFESLTKSDDDDVDDQDGDAEDFEAEERSIVQGAKKVRRIVVCLDCPRMQCSIDSPIAQRNAVNPNYLRLKRLAGGSRLDVFCLLDSSQQFDLIVSNLQQTTCQVSRNCRALLEHSIEKAHGTVPRFALPFAFEGPLLTSKVSVMTFGTHHEPIYPSCTYFAKCLLIEGYGSEQLVEEVVKCPDGTYFSEVTASCIGHDSQKFPCQPNVCKVKKVKENIDNFANYARIMAASALEGAASMLSARSTDTDRRKWGPLDVDKMLMMLQLNRTSQQSCIPLAAESGNCRAFATCHPESSQTLLHCCPPGRTLLPGTCSCVDPTTYSQQAANQQEPLQIATCPLTVSCTPNEGEDVLWNEVYASEHQGEVVETRFLSAASSNSYNSAPWSSSVQSSANEQKSNQTKYASVRLKSGRVVGSTLLTESQEQIAAQEMKQPETVLNPRKSRIQNRNKGLLLMTMPQQPKQKRGRVMTASDWTEQKQPDQLDVDLNKLVDTVIRGSLSTIEMASKQLEQQHQQLQQRQQAMQLTAPTTGEICYDGVSGQRRRGPTPNTDAPQVFYIYDMISGEWERAQCSAGSVFNDNHSVCACSVATLGA